jgi:uncharacterized protein
MTPVTGDAQVIAAAIRPRDRIDAIDVVRGVALFGVVAVNVLTAFRVSIFQQFIASGRPVQGLDGLVERFTSFALEMKAFSLFSLLFGLGLAMQLDRLARGDKPYYFLVRRLLVLLAFGLMHLTFIWNGDILTEYALAGLVVLPLLRLSRSSLAAVAVGLLTLYGVLAVIPPLLPLAGPEVLAEHIGRANTVYAHGSFADVFRFSIREIALLVPHT